MNVIIQYLKRLPFAVIVVLPLCIFALFVYLWAYVFAPSILSIPKDFSYNADVVSYDDFYDPQTSSYTGPVQSDTKFSYKTVGTVGDVLKIENTFDVRKPTGERIFAVSRQYGINDKTGAHVAGYGDKNRSGYLFAPRNLHKQDFDYWHVNYDVPAHMKFQGEEKIAGVTTYRYRAAFQADQTKNLTNLPGVGVDKGISLDATLQLWVEPTTGYLVKYHDDTVAYYFSLKGGERLYPWNHFSNSYTFTSTAAHAREAEGMLLTAWMVQVGAPAIVAVAVFATLVLFIARRGVRTDEGYKIPAIVAAVIAVVSLLFWYVFGPTVKVSEDIAPMYPGAALGVIALAVVVMSLPYQHKWTSRRRLAIGWSMGITSIIFGLSTLGQLYGFGLPAITVLVHGGSAPFVLPLAAAGIAIFAFCLGVELVTRWAWLALVREAQAAFGMCLMVVSLLSYAYGQSTPLLVWLHAIRWPAALALVLIGISIFMYEQDFLITRQLRRLGKGAWLFVAVLLSSLALTGLVWQASVTAASQQTDLQFQSDINTLQSALSDRLRIYTGALYGGRGLFAASNSVERDEWRRYVSGLHVAENYPGSQGMGYAQIIPKDQLAKHIADTRAQGFPGYTVQPSDPKRDVYSAVVYLEPFDARNQRAFGYDMLTESTRRTALDRARDSGEAAMTGRVTLLQETNADAQYGFLIYVPVYRNGAPLATIEQRRAALTGYVYSPFRMNNFMQSVLGNLANGVGMEIFDSADPTKLTDANRMFGDATSNNHTLRDVQTITIDGHTWSIRYTGSADYIRGVDQSLPAVALYGGAVLSFLLAVAVFVLTSSRQRAVRYASELTADLVVERNQAVRLQQKDETVLASISEGLIVFNADGHIERVNAAAQRLLGYREDELLGTQYSSVLKALDTNSQPLPASRRPVARVLDHKKPINRTQLQYIRKDGHWFAAELSIAPLIFKGRLLGAIEIFRDVTQERALDKAKTEFVSLASHQLRTPLSAINWYAEMLLTGDAGKINKTQREYLQEIFEGNKRMTELVRSLLDTSRLDLGKIINVPREIALQDTIKDMEKELGPAIRKKRQRLKEHIDPKTPRLFADPKLMRIIVQNFMSNAVKYTPNNGTLTIGLRPAQATDLIAASKPRAQADRYVVFSVEDTGYGIPSDQRDKIFQKLFRADNVRRLDTEGAGLGLYIVREVLDRLGGTVWYDSVESVGSTFWALIPTKTKAVEAQSHDQVATQNTGKG